VQSASPDALQQHQWVFDPSILKPGDVVLERDDGKQSAAITGLDGGSFSHALFWLGGSDFIEATDGGSRVISFARVGVYKPSRWSALRFIGAETTMRTIADHAHSLLSAGGYYNFIDDQTKADVASRASFASAEEVSARKDTLLRHQQNLLVYSGINRQRPWPLWAAHERLYIDLSTFFAYLVQAARG
jgi:hypothetical protein